MKRNWYFTAACSTANHEHCHNNNFECDCDCHKQLEWPEQLPEHEYPNTQDQLGKEAA